MSNGDKVWVEAEQDGRGGVALTLVDVAERRRVSQVYGRHVVNTQLDNLRNFPTRYSHQLQLGYPVRFKMNQRAFEDMLVGHESPSAAGFQGLGDLRRPRGDWALVRSRGLDDDVLSVHKTKEQAENAMRKRGGEPNSMMQNGMRVVNIGPGGDEMIEVMGKWTIRPRNIFGGRPTKPSNELDGDDILDDELENEPPTQDDLNNSAVIYEVRRGYALVIDGKTIETFTTRQHEVPQDAAFQYVRAWMDKNKYWPNLYFVNERGNIELMDHQTGKFLKGWV